MPDNDNTDPRTEPLGSGWITVAVVIGVMAALIALGGMILSYRAVSAEMIPAFGTQWAWLVPIVVDLTVFVFSGVDLVLARLDMSHPLARLTVYVATGGTVYLNYSAGGTLPGRIAHVLMPSIWVVFVELMRHVVRRQVNLATASHREPVPVARWFLSPWPTLKLWRRMVLWRVNSYPRALDTERGRLHRIAGLRVTHGRLWRLRVSALEKLDLTLGETTAPVTSNPGQGALDAASSARPAAAPAMSRDASLAVTPTVTTVPGRDTQGVRDTSPTSHPVTASTPGTTSRVPSRPPLRPVTPVSTINVAADLATLADAEASWTDFTAADAIRRADELVPGHQAGYIVRLLGERGVQVSTDNVRKVRQRTRKNAEASTPEQAADETEGRIA